MQVYEISKNILFMKRMSHSTFFVLDDHMKCIIL